MLYVALIQGSSTVYPEGISQEPDQPKNQALIEGLQEIVNSPAETPVSEIELGNVCLHYVKEPNCRSISTCIYDLVKKLMLASNSCQEDIELIIIFHGQTLPGNGYWILDDGIFQPMDLISIFKNIFLDWSNFKRMGLQDSFPKLAIRISTPGENSWKFKFLGDPDHDLVTEFAQMSLQFLGLFLTEMSVNVHYATPSEKTKPSPAAPRGSKATEKVETPRTNKHGCMTKEEKSLFCQCLATIMSWYPPSDLTDLTLRPSKARTSSSYYHIGEPTIFIFPESTGNGSILSFPNPEYYILINTGNFRPLNETMKLGLNLKGIDCIILTEWSLENAKSLNHLSKAISKRLVPGCLCLPTMGSRTKKSDRALSVPSLVQDSINKLNECKDGPVFQHVMRRGTTFAETCEPIILTEKLGHGAVELYTLTPSEEDFKDEISMQDIWNENAENFLTACALKKTPSDKQTTKLVSKFSTSFLVVWRSSDKMTSIPLKHGFEPTKLLRVLVISKLANQDTVLQGLQNLSYRPTSSQKAKPTSSYKPVHNTNAANSTAKASAAASQAAQKTDAKLVVDVCYIPETSCDSFDKLKLWFTRVRAQKYIVTNWCPNSTIIQALIEVKRGIWTLDNELLIDKVDLVFAHQSESILRVIMGDEQTKMLKKLNINILGFADCTGMLLKWLEEDENEFNTKCMKVPLIDP